MTDLSSAQGRYYLLDSPVASPGLCGVCGYASNDRRYLDPRLDFEFYGTLIFCEECIASMAAMFGWLTPELVKELEHRVENAETQLVQTRAAVAAMEDLRVALGAFGSGDSDSRRGSSSLPESFAHEADFVVEVDVSGEGFRDSTPDVTSLLSGSDDVRDDSADDPFGFNL